MRNDNPSELCPICGACLGVWGELGLGKHKHFGEKRDKIAELAQKLYNDDGFLGNVYKKSPTRTLRYYENKAQEILEKEG